MGQRFSGRFINPLLLIGVVSLLVLIALHLVYPRTVSPITTFVWSFVVFSFLLGLFLNWYLQPKRDTTPRKDFVDIFMKFASSLFVIGSLLLAWLSLANTQLETAENLQLARTTLENNRAEQRSRRFMEALEKLGGETPPKRLAGVYAFQQLDSDLKSKEEFDKEFKVLEANNSSTELAKSIEKSDRELKEHWAIMEILTHFIQEVSPVVKGPTKANKPDIPQTEVHEILKYLGTRKLFYRAGEVEGLNFFYADLSGYAFNNTDRNNAKDRPNFEGAQFVGARLKKANFEGVKLSKAKFTDADLTEAILRDTDLTDADFRNANLAGADLTGAKLNKDDQLESAFADEKTKCPNDFTYHSGTCLKITSIATK